MIDPTPDLLGAELCAWEQAAAIELPTTRLRVAAMSERVYNESAGRIYADFAARLAATDDELSRMLQSLRVVVTFEGWVTNVKKGREAIRAPSAWHSLA